MNQYLLPIGIIRTPIDPSITFKDDPLRVLRALRFASRFSFTLHESILRAARSEDVRAAFLSKVCMFIESSI